MKTLKLFNGVVSKSSNEKPFISEDGFIIEPSALWAKDEILSYYSKEELRGNDLNKTFHKSWEKIVNSSRFELLVDQIRHYISTYGSNFQDEIYIPTELLNVPELKLKYKVIKAYTKDELVEKCLSLLTSGIALKEETIDDVLSVLIDELDYQFTGKEGIKNKEAIIKLADLYNILPTNTMDFFRYVIYRATGESLLIKSEGMISRVKESSYNPAVQFKKFGLEKLAEIFNRFKPLFLAFKPQSKKTINKIAKLSKKFHKPMVQNPLNLVTTRMLSNDDMHWLDNATPFALFKALSAMYTRMNGQDSFVYRIRSGKSWIKEEKINTSLDDNFKYLLTYIKYRFKLSGKKIYLPKDVEFALPTSEKMYIGNIPTGTRFFGEKLAVGIYWEDSWGARDLDLSGLNIAGKVGWNASYNQNTNLLYSGDITSAPNGAVEYLYANEGLEHPTLVQNNVYTGGDECGYKIIVGRGDDISKKYMMNPNELFAQVRCESVERNTILGMMIPEKDRQAFVLLNFGAGSARVSGYTEVSNIATKALYQQWKNPLSFNWLVDLLGAELVEVAEMADFDYSLDSLEKDSFIKLFQ